MSKIKDIESKIGALNIKLINLKEKYAVDKEKYLKQLEPLLLQKVNLIKEQHDKKNWDVWVEQGRSSAQFKSLAATIRSKITAARKNGLLIVPKTNCLYLEKDKNEQFLIKTKDECGPLDPIILMNNIQPIVRMNGFAYFDTIARAIDRNPGWVIAFHSGYENKPRPIDDACLYAAAYWLGQKIRGEVERKQKTFVTK